MSTKKKLLCIFLFIILDVFLVVAYLTFYSLTQENNLKKEVNKLTKLDVTKDRYNLGIVTRGNYGKVEKKIKVYLDNYAVSLQSVTKLLSSEKITKLLSATNYSSDGPEFSESIKYINATKVEVNREFDNLIKSCSEEEIIKYIEGDNIDDYYKDLYRKLMLDDNMTKDFFKTKQVLENNKTKINNILDVSLEVFGFLQINKNNWKIENNQILFQTNDLINQYNSLIQKIK